MVYSYLKNFDFEVFLFFFCNHQIIFIFAKTVIMAKKGKFMNNDFLIWIEGRAFLQQSMTLIFEHKTWVKLLLIVL